jgi:dihydrodipicolinate synthase
MFKGAYVALATPFKNHLIDFPALKNLVEFQIAQGIHGILACGSTGESFFLSDEEHYQVLKTVVEITNGRVPVIAGAGAFTPAQSLKLAQAAESLPVDGLLIVTPPYVKPSQAALIDYFTFLHDNLRIPLILYDNPGRSAQGISNQTVATLARLPRIVALKDSSGDLTRPADLLALLPEDFTLLSGEDATTPGFYAQGGHGVISATANFAPKLVAQQWQAWIDQDLTRFAQLRSILNPLYRAAFCETNPVPAKYALSQLGLCDNEVRPPLTPLSEQGRKIIDAALCQAGLISAQLSEVAHG